MHVIHMCDNHPLRVVSHEQAVVNKCTIDIATAIQLPRKMKDSSLNCPYRSVSDCYCLLCSSAKKVADME